MRWSHPRSRYACCGDWPRSARSRSSRPFHSERERQIAEIIAKGRTNQEIAAELFISLSTVKTHLASIQHKLGVRNRVGIAAWAWESKL